MVNFQQIRCVLLYLVFPFMAFSQEPEIRVPNDLVIRSLYRSGTVTSKINWYKKGILKFLPIKDNPFDTYSQELFLINKNFYVFLNASGIVYKSHNYEPQNDSVIFKRIDITDHYGYNINCFPLYYNNQLFNIGGYGYWRWNGQLRVFNEKLGEWDISQLNQEVSVAQNEQEPNIWYDGNLGDLYALSFMAGNEAVNSSAEYQVRRIDTVMMLDLKEKKWISKGVLEPSIAKDLPTASLIVNLDSGLLVNFNGRTEYWNLIKNERRLLIKNSIQQKLTTKVFECFIWSKEGKVYIGRIPRIGDFKEPYFDSVSLNPMDFSSLNLRIYKPISDSYNKSQLVLWVLIIGAILLLSYVFYFIFKKFKKNNKEEGIREILKPAYKQPDLFIGSELAVLNLIIENIELRGRRTNIEEINRVLGLANKSSEMQKKTRSQTLKSINEKYAIVMQKSDFQLINRSRSELDGRLIEIYIEKQEIQQLKSIIPSNENLKG